MGPNMGIWGNLMVAGRGVNGGERGMGWVAAAALVCHGKVFKDAAVWWWWSTFGLKELAEAAPEAGWVTVAPPPPPPIFGLRPSCCV